MPPPGPGGAALSLFLRGGGARGGGGGGRPDAAGGAQGWSLYAASSYALWPYLLFGLTAAGAVALTAGYRVPTVAPLLFLLTLSLQNRVRVALDDGDLVILASLLALSWRRGRPELWLQMALCLGQAHFLWVGGSRAAGLALGLAPLALLLGRGPGRGAGLMGVALAYLSALPGAGGDLTPGLGLAGLTLWWDPGPFDELPLRQRASRAVVAQAALTTTCVALMMAWQMPGLAQARAFLALGPRSSQLPLGLSYTLRAVGPEDRDLAGAPYFRESYRKRLYSGALERPENWALRYWLALSFYAAEGRRDGSPPPHWVELWRRSDGPERSRETLFARWPREGG